MTTLYYGSFVHSVSLDELDFCLDALVCVSEDGYISWVERNVDPSQLQDAASRHGVNLDDVDFVELGRNDFLCPGLIDTHTVSHCVYRHHHHQEIHGLTSVEPPCKACTAVSQPRTRPRVSTVGLAIRSDISPGKNVCRSRLCSKGLRTSGPSNTECGCE